MSKAPSIPPTVDALRVGLGIYFKGDLDVEAAGLHTFLAGYYSAPVSDEATAILKAHEANPPRETKLLIEELNAFHDAIDQGGSIHLLCNSNTDQMRRNFRAVLREAAAALANSDNQSGKGSAK